MNTLVNEILSFVFVNNEHTNDFSEFEWYHNFVNQVENWVNTNNVTDIEYTLDVESVNNIFATEFLFELTYRPITLVDNYNKLEVLVDNVLQDNKTDVMFNEGLNANVYYNNEYFYFGSSGSFYVLIKSVN